MKVFWCNGIPTLIFPDGSFSTILNFKEVQDAKFRIWVYLLPDVEFSKR